MTRIPGIGLIGGGVVTPATIGYLQRDSDNTNAQSYTFPTINFGTASLDRSIVIVVAAKKNSGTPAPISTATIGGISATITVQTETGAALSAILIADVPTGTTGAVVINFSGGNNLDRVTIDTYNALNIGSVVANDTAADFESTAANLSVLLDTPANGFAVSGAMLAGQSSAFTWTGLTENADAVSGSDTATCASENVTAAQTAETITAGNTVANPKTMVAASWGVDIVPLAVPTNLAVPEISGTPNPGQTLTTDTGAWSNSPTSFAAQWKRNGSDISGETGQTYLVVVGDAGATITCGIIATNSIGSSTQAVSNGLAVVGQAPTITTPPVVTGNTQQGSVLSSTTGVWTNNPTSYAYQWRRNAGDIGGQTNANYTTQVADISQLIDCKVTATNSFGSSTPSDSNDISVTGIPPANTVAPVISGSTVIGGLLTTTNGTWTGSATITFTYQWKRNGADIATATNQTYTTVTIDIGTSVTCQVTANNGWGSPVSANSNALAITGLVPVNTGAPVVTGTGTVGQTLSTTDGTWGNTPTSFTYQWNRGGTPISAATNNTYLLVTADAGTSITCSVTAINATGNSTPAVSNAISVAGLAPVNTVLPAVTGTPNPGFTLTTDNGTWSNNPTGFAYQWKRGVTNIGTNQNTYVLVAADAGNNVTCTVTASNAQGAGTPAVSNAIAVVGLAPANTVPPVVTGATAVGSLLTTTNGTWANQPVSFSYSWRRAGTPIGAPNLNTYTTVTADIGTAVDCLVTATNTFGSNSLDSNDISVVGLIPVNTVLPALTGTPTVGNTLTSGTGTWINDPDTFTYQWKRDNVAISLATNSSYTLVSADGGTQCKCTVTATNEVGSASVDSNALAVTASAPVNSAAPVVTGDTAIGSLLSCTTGSWTNTPTGYTYQWKRGGSDISGATANTYTTTNSDATTNVLCTVVASNAGGSSAPANSNAITVDAAAGGGAIILRSLDPIVGTTADIAAGATFDHNNVQLGDIGTRLMLLFMAQFQSSFEITEASTIITVAGQPTTSLVFDISYTGAAAQIFITDSPVSSTTGTIAITNNGGFPVSNHALACVEVTGTVDSVDVTSITGDSADPVVTPIALNIALGSAGAAGASANNGASAISWTGSIQKQLGNFSGLNYVMNLNEAVVNETISSTALAALARTMAVVVLNPGASASGLIFTSLTPPPAIIGGSNVTTFTIFGANIGKIGSRCVIMHSGSYFGTALTAMTCTVDGRSATSIDLITGPGSLHAAAFITDDPVVNTTGDLVFTYTVGTNVNYIYVFPVQVEGSIESYTVVKMAKSTGAGLVATTPEQVVIESGGGALSVSTNLRGSSTVITWAGGNEEQSQIGNSVSGKLWANRTVSSEFISLATDAAANCALMAVSFKSGTPAPVITASLTWLQATFNATAQTTYTYNSVNFGVAADDRVMVIGFFSRAATSRSFVSATIGGIAANLCTTQVVGNNLVMGIINALVPTGATGTVAITFNGSMSNGCEIYTYSGSNIGALEPADTVNSTLNSSSNVTGTIDVPTNGTEVAVGHVTATSAPITWTGIDLDVQTSSDNSRPSSAAHRDVTTALPNNIITMVSAAATNKLMSAASFYPPELPRSGASIQYLVRPAANTNSLFTYDFTNTYFGEPHAERYIIVSVHCKGNNSTPELITAASIGGVTATISAQISSGAARNAIICAKVPTGWSGTVSITWANNQSRNDIDVYRALNLSSATPVDTATQALSSSANLTGNIDVPLNGIVVGGANCLSAGTEFVWTGITQDKSAAVGSDQSTCASLEVTTALTNTTIVAVLTANNPKCLSLASFGSLL